MKHTLCLTLLLITLGVTAQTGKVYSEGQIESELNPNLAALEQRKKDWQAILLDKEAAKKAVEAYFIHKNKAYENLDEGELDLAYAKLIEAKELMGRAHTKFVAYYAKQGRQDMINVYGGEFTDVIKTYEQYLSSEAIESDRAMCKPISELYLVKSENKVVTVELDPEDPDEDFWVMGDAHEQKEASDNCGVHFSGRLIGSTVDSSWLSRAYQVDKNSEYVGSGHYPNNEDTFPKAVDSTFDGIAIDEGTRLIIYSKPNFKGEILVNIVGPAIINNRKFKNDDRINYVMKQDFGDLQTKFPFNTRFWSETDMHDWSYGSCKIICEK